MISFAEQIPHHHRVVELCFVKRLRAEIMQIVQNQTRQIIKRLWPMSRRGFV
jgi:hypothetical protein